jgi:hypothetical protein
LSGSEDLDEFLALEDAASRDVAELQDSFKRGFCGHGDLPSGAQAIDTVAVAAVELDAEMMDGEGDGEDNEDEEDREDGDAMDVDRDGIAHKDKVREAKAWVGIAAKIHCSESPPLTTHWHGRKLYRLTALSSTLDIRVASRQRKASWRFEM